MRIADKFGLKKRDTVLIKPFGTSKTYPVTVAGTYRSVSESILITTECADTIGISGLILRNRLHKLIRSTDSEKERINNMKKTVLHINGMMCGMCESHINDVIRREFKIKKVTSSHSKGITEILSEEPLNEEQLRNAIKQTGYTLTEIEIADAPEKKGFFAAMKSGKKDK